MTLGAIGPTLELWWLLPSGAGIAWFDIERGDNATDQHFLRGCTGGDGNGERRLFHSFDVYHFEFADRRT